MRAINILLVTNILPITVKVKKMSSGKISNCKSKKKNSGKISTYIRATHGAINILSDQYLTDAMLHYATIGFFCAIPKLYDNWHNYLVPD